MSLTMPTNLDWLWILVAGDKFPRLDEDRLRQVALDLISVASKLGVMKPLVVMVADVVSQEFEGEAAEAFVSKMRRYVSSGDGSLDDAAASAAELAELVLEFARTGEYIKFSLIGEVVALAIEIATAIALAPYTFGASMLGLGVKIAGTRAIVKMLLTFLITRIAPWAGIESLIEGNVSLLSQEAQIKRGHRNSIDWGLAGPGFASGAISGALSALFGDWASKFFKFGAGGGFKGGWPGPKAPPPKLPAPNHQPTPNNPKPEAPPPPTKTPPLTTATPDPPPVTTRGLPDTTTPLPKGATPPPLPSPLWTNGSVHWLTHIGTELLSEILGEGITNELFGENFEDVLKDGMPGFIAANIAFQSLLDQWITRPFGDKLTDAVGGPIHIGGGGGGLSDSDLAKLKDDIVRHFRGNGEPGPDPRNGKGGGGSDQSGSGNGGGDSGFDAGPIPPSNLDVDIPTALVPPSWTEEQVLTGENLLKTPVSWPLGILSPGSVVVGPHGVVVSGAGGLALTVPLGSTIGSDGAVTYPDGQRVIGPDGVSLTVPSGSVLAPLPAPSEAVVVRPGGVVVSGAGGLALTVPLGSTIGSDGAVTYPDGQRVIGPDGVPLTVPSGSVLAPLPAQSEAVVVRPDGVVVSGAGGLALTVPLDSTIGSDGAVTGPGGRDLVDPDGRPLTVPSGSVLAPLPAPSEAVVVRPDGVVVSGAGGLALTVPLDSTIGSDGAVTGPGGRDLVDPDGRPLTVPSGSVLAPLQTTSDGSLLPGSNGSAAPASEPGARPVQPSPGKPSVGQPNQFPQRPPTPAREDGSPTPPPATEIETAASLDPIFDALIPTPAPPLTPPPTLPPTTIGSDHVLAPQTTPAADQARTAPISATGSPEFVLPPGPIPPRIAFHLDNKRRGRDGDPKADHVLSWATSTVLSGGSGTYVIGEIKGFRGRWPAPTRHDWMVTLIHLSRDNPDREDGLLALAEELARCA